MNKISLIIIPIRREELSPNLLCTLNISYAESQLRSNLGDTTQTTADDGICKTLNNDTRLRSKMINPDDIPVVLNL